jgi:hypothetical protein
MCLDCNAELADDGAVSPRGRLSFGGSPADAAAAASGPRGPWRNIAKGGEVDSPSAQVAAGGGSPSREVVDTEILGLIRAMRTQMDAPVAAPQKNLSADEISVLVNRGGSPLAGLEFKQALPVINDSDLDFDRHMRELRSIVDCYAMKKSQGVRPYDLLVIFRRTLAPGGTRLKIYDNSIAQAQKDNRLPHQAQQIYDDILKKIRSVLRESIFTKQTRIEIEFNQLEMGRLSHPASSNWRIGCDGTFGWRGYVFCSTGGSCVGYYRVRLEAGRAGKVYL